MARLRKASATLFLLAAMGCVLMMYLVIDMSANPELDPDLNKIELDSLESKLKSLEKDLVLNQKTIDKIRDTVEEMQQEQVS